MITHKFIAGKSKTGFTQQTLVIMVDSLKNEGLIEAINYLIDHVHTIYDWQEEANDHIMWPIEFHLKDYLVLCESSFWKCVFESFAGGYEYIQRYIKKLCTLTEQSDYGTLLQSNEYNFHGGLAFNQYWLWGIENPFPDMQETVKSLRDFNVWLSMNELDYEVTQDDMISLILCNFRFYDADAKAELIAIRLNGGQRSEKEFDYLLNALCYHDRQQSGYFLKLVIDKLIEARLFNPGGSELQSTYLELCAVIYGSNVVTTAVVMDYVIDNHDKELYKPEDFEMKKINYLRQVGDIYWQQATSQNRYIDTSFHLFDTHTKKWIDYDERED